MEARLVTLVWGAKLLLRRGPHRPYNGRRHICGAQPLARAWHCGARQRRLALAAAMSAAAARSLTQPLARTQPPAGGGDDGGTTDSFGEIVAAEWDRWRGAHQVRAYYAPASGWIANSKHAKPGPRDGSGATSSAAPGPHCGAASGAGRVQQETRIGKYITLAQMFRMGCRPCTCFDLYCTRTQIGLCFRNHSRRSVQVSLAKYHRGDLSVRFAVLSYPAIIRDVVAALVVLLSTLCFYFVSLGSSPWRM